MAQASVADLSPLSGATVRALSSLTRRDADAVRATVRAAARGHAVQEHDDYDGYLSLLVMPEAENRASFMISGRTGAVDVAELWNDDMASLGTFASIGAAMLVLRPALERDDAKGGRGPACREAAKLQRRHGAEASLHAALRADAEPSRPGWASVLRVLDGEDRRR